MNTFSIILPVRNGGTYLKDCVKSILAQTYRHFNLIVLDNNSSDGSKEWIESLADEHIIIYTSDIPLTIEDSWKRILNVPTNEYITLIGHDDLLEPSYLFEMNNLITEYPDASLYQTHFNYINEKGAVIRACKPMAKVETGANFLKTVLTDQFDIMGTGFLMKAIHYKQVGGIPMYPNLLFADFELWQSLTDISYKVTSPKNCFSFRIHNSTTSNANDKLMQEAFFRYIDYLKILKEKNVMYAEIIAEHFPSFIKDFSRKLSHRLLRSPLYKRDYITVKHFLEECKEKNAILMSGNKKSTTEFSIQLAKFIDSNYLTRKLFLLFKKIRKRPILK